MSDVSVARVPTVDDLRVKHCYICWEEERWDEINDPPRVWIHPCNCTLVAHQPCLLRWINTSLQNPSRALNALNCPQCGMQYELRSQKPVILRLLDWGNKGLSLLGRMYTVACISGFIITVATGTYVACTAYGAYAVYEFLGKESFDLILSEDVSRWPWHAWFNLPLIPLSLIIGRLPLGSQIFPVTPFLVSWQTASPTLDNERIIFNYWNHRDNIRAVAQPPTLLTWPPSPALCGLILFPVIRSFYQKCFTRFARYILNNPTLGRSRNRNTNHEWVLNGPGGNALIRIGIQRERREVAPRRDRQAQPEQPPQPEQPMPAQGEQNAELPPEDADPVEEAEEIIRTSAGTSLGRLVGGALLIPRISSFMGSMLYRLSRYSYILRRVLAAPALPLARRPSPPLGRFSFPEAWKSLSTLQQLLFAGKLGTGVLLGGTTMFRECDPVWWRNALGMGLFVALKDCIQLLHLWLTKRDLETREVKSRSFAGIDLTELDLIPSFVVRNA